ncbi:NEAT domain-containing protein [Sporosarcina ureilytica]|uniref:NEAT domain-containing protein n=1 Tax=Sporosarcina ureilytica TaxID=298596 RepID=A0A1D8JE08_9BACL|nr:NEAT domain-containing protein [Sporosarcina ureilytica]AOV06946.1 hypothetical protein BI350_04755 [Sporosarcina ureilytica]
MRNKWLMSLLIAILALPFFSGAVFAEETKQFADGEHKITAKALNADTGEPSGAAGFINEAATLTIKNGEATLTITVPHNPMAEITGLQIEGINPTVTKGANATYMAFKLANVKSELNATVSYEVPSLNMVHDNLPLKFALVGLDTIPTVEEVKPEEPTEPEVPVEEPTEEEPVEEPAKPETPVENMNPALVPDKAYTINFVSESRSVNGQFNNPAAVLHKNGETFIQMTGTGGQFIKSLTINGEEVTWGQKNDDGTFTFQFKVNGSLSTVLDFGMVIDARGTEMTHVVDLTFDESTKADADAASYSLLAVNQEVEVPSEDEEQADKEDSNKSEEQEESADKNENNKETETPAKDPLAPDKAYEIDFVFKHETEDKASAADNFFVKPAILLEKDGERYIQITVTGSEYIESLKNKFGEFVVVKTNADGSVVYQFKLDGSISDAMLIDMVITVPGFYESQTHKARLFLDESSMKEIDASQYQLAAASNGNGPTVDGKSGNDIIPPKPELGGSDKNNVKNQEKTVGKVTNPQTGDTTNIMLYVLLLIGSAIPLAIQLKRRFANAA